MSRRSRRQAQQADEQPQPPPATQDPTGAILQEEIAALDPAELSNPDAVINGIRFGLTKISKLAEETIPHFASDDLKSSVADRLEACMLKLIKAETMYSKAASIVTDMVESMPEETNSDAASILRTCEQISDVSKERIGDFSENLTDEELKANKTYRHFVNNLQKLLRGEAADSNILDDDDDEDEDNDDDDEDQDNDDDDDDEVEEDEEGGGGEENEDEDEEGETEEGVVEAAAEESDEDEAESDDDEQGDNGDNNDEDDENEDDEEGSTVEQPEVAAGQDDDNNDEDDDSDEDEEVEEGGEQQSGSDEEEESSSSEGRTDPQSEIVPTVAEVEEEDEEEESEEEILENEEELLPTIDPVTKQELKDPVRNQKCGHIYGKAAMAQLIKKNSKTRCPIAGCSNKEFIKLNQLVADRKLTMEIRKKQAEEKKQNKRR